MITLWGQDGQDDQVGPVVAVSSRLQPYAITVLKICGEHTRIDFEEGRQRSNHCSAEWLFSRQYF